VSKDAASLVVALVKNLFGWGRKFLVSDVISGGLFGHLGPLHLAMGANSHMVAFHLMFLLETRLQSKSCDTLDDLLGFGFKSYDLSW